MALHKLQDKAATWRVPSTRLCPLCGLSQLQLIHLNYFYRRPIGAFSNIATISAVFCRQQQQDGNDEAASGRGSLPACHQPIVFIINPLFDCRASPDSCAPDWIAHNSFIQKCPVPSVRSRRDGPSKERLRQRVRQNVAAAALIMEFPGALMTS